MLMETFGFLHSNGVSSSQISGSVYSLGEVCIQARRHSEAFHSLHPFPPPSQPPELTMSDIEAPAVVHVNTNEKKDVIDDSSSSSENRSYTAGGSRDPDDMVRRRLKQRHIQM
jgi:hypothetical protein